MEILEYILIVIVAIVASPIIKGLVNKFVEEDVLEEKAANNKVTKKESNKKNADKKGRNKENNDETKIKVKFVPEFDWKVTAVTVLAEIILFITFGISVQFFIYGFLTLLLIVCMFSDIKGCIIPNEINFVGFIVGIILTFWKMLINVNAALDALAGMLVGFLVFLAIAGLSVLIFKKEGMGGGDIKLMGVIGLYVGLFNNIQIFILSFFIAAIISIFLLVTKIKKSDDYIPFGPFIVLATYLTFFFPASTLMPIVVGLLV